MDILLTILGIWTAISGLILLILLLALPPREEFDAWKRRIEREERKAILARLPRYTHGAIVPRIRRK